MKAKNTLIKAVTNLHVALIRSTHGKVGAHPGSMDVCVLTTTGRKSGAERRNPLAYFPHPEGIALVASANGSDKHPAWYLNLAANPEVKVEIDGVEKPMTARTASDAEKAQLWPGIIAKVPSFDSYRAKTSRNIPVVILTTRAT
jgi:deazaflavin-dependent oxidoreductase (nitroreductase family)